MSLRVFNAVSGVVGALALGAGVGAVFAIHRTCRRLEWEGPVLAAGFVAAILVFGLLLGRLLLMPTRTALLAAAAWAATMALGFWVFARQMVECFNT